MITDAEVEGALNWKSENLGKLVKASADRKALEKSEKRILALIAKQHEGSVAHQQQEALASKEYADFLEGLKEAIREDEKMKRLWDLATEKREVWQTQSANQRRI